MMRHTAHPTRDQADAVPIEFHGGYQVYSESGVDLTLLRENLKLSVTARWEQNRRALETVEAFREAGRVRRQRVAATTD